MSYENIQNAENGFSTITGSFTAAPIFSYFKSEGVGKDGIQWDDTEIATVDVGADGLATRNSKPAVYTGTFSYKPNSSTRRYLDQIVYLSTVTYGKRPTSYELTYTQNNHVTGTKTIFAGGIVTSAQGGNSANLDEGQADIAYKITFTSKVILPLS